MITFTWVVLIVVAALVVVDSWLYAKREDERQGYQPKNPVDLNSVKMPRDEPQEKL